MDSTIQHFLLKTEEARHVLDSAADLPTKRALIFGPIFNSLFSTQLLPTWNTRGLSDSDACKAFVALCEERADNLKAAYAWQSASPKSFSDKIAAAVRVLRG